MCPLVPALPGLSELALYLIDAGPKEPELEDKEPKASYTTRRKVFTGTQAGVTMGVVLTIQSIPSSML
jgi:hypothetical protein